MWTLRDARPDDAAAVARVHVRTWQIAYRGLLPDEYLDGQRPEARAARYAFGSPNPNLPSTVVAVDDGVIRGFATTGRSRDADSSATGELLGLYVEPEAWGLGVGRLLIADARARLHTRGFSEATLWVLVGNHRAHRFYRCDGWQPDGRSKTDQVRAVPVEVMRYRRSLP